MKPYVQHVHAVEKGQPGRRIRTIKGKARFVSWLEEYYFDRGGGAVCFRVEGWPEGSYLEALPVIRRRKRRIFYVRIPRGQPDMSGDVGV